MSLKIALVCGGRNEECEVSLSSSAMVVPVLRQLGYAVQVVQIGPGPQTLSETEAPRVIADFLPAVEDDATVPTDRTSQQTAFLEHVRAFDLVFIALHGGTGEDGTVQAALDLMNLPYTGSGHAASAVCMDKDLSKRLLRAAGIATPDWTLFESTSHVRPDGFSYPVVVKPNRQGSTVGLTIVRDAASLMDAVEFAFRFDSEVLIEQFVAGRELTVGLLDDRPLAVGEILIDAETAFNYEDKYTAGAVVEEFPANLTPAVTEIIQATAMSAHKILKLRDYSRADFRLDNDGKLWLLELNSLPGLTATSLFPQSARAMGIEFPQLCDMICQLALRRHSESCRSHR